KTARLARQARGARLVAESIGFLLLFHVAPFPPVPFVTPLQSAATASLTTFVTFARMSASLERSIMSSSGMVMNLRLGPLVREIRNMLLDGVTGITTCTAASIPFTRSRNFCFPASSSSIVTLYPAPQERWSAPSNFGVKVAGLSPTARIGRAQLHRAHSASTGGQPSRPASHLRRSAPARQQLLHFLNDHVRPGQIHVANPLPADDAVLVDHVHVRDEFPSAVQFVRDL